MPGANPPRPSDELARLSKELFDRVVRPRLGADEEGKFVAIDVASGDFEIDEDDYAAVTLLHARHSAADVWLELVGFPTAYQMRPK